MDFDQEGMHLSYEERDLFGSLPENPIPISMAPELRHLAREVEAFHIENRNYKLIIIIGHLITQLDGVMVPEFHSRNESFRPAKIKRRRGDQC